MLTVQVLQATCSADLVSTMLRASTHMSEWTGDRFLSDAVQQTTAATVL
jgi:hypothetical protein